MYRAAFCCFVTVSFATTAALAQRATGVTPPPSNRPAPRQPAPQRPAPAPAKPAQRPEKPNAAGDSGPLRPAGFKPITLKTAQLESERLRASITSVEEQIRKLEADPASKSDESDGDKPAAKAPESAEQASVSEKKSADKEGPKKTDSGGPAAKSGEKPTLASVERENRTLRRQLDQLLVKLVKLDGTLDKRAAGLPPYDAHILDSPQNGAFCPGKTMDELEHTMRFAGIPVGESGDNVCYEWIFHTTNAKRAAHATHRVWAVVKDGMSTEVKEAAPGVLKEGPPPRTKPS